MCSTNKSITAIGVMLIGTLAAGFLWISAVSGQDRPDADKTDSGEKIVATSRPRRTESVKTASFYLLDGTSIIGRVIAEDKNQITVEGAQDSKVVVRRYRKTNIERGAIVRGKLSEIKYYKQLAEYFESRTGDFVDDADDFISAIRYYEKTKRLLQSLYGDDYVLAKKIAAKIEELRADQDTWAEEVSDRAELKELEFKATFDVKLADLEKKIGEVFEQLTQTIKNVSADQKTLTESTAKFSRAIDQAKYDIDRNKDEINELWLITRYSRSYYRRSGSRTHDPNSR